MYLHAQALVLCLLSTTSGFVNPIVSGGRAKMPPDKFLIIKQRVKKEGEQKHPLLFQFVNCQLNIRFFIVII